ncbi:MAG: RNA polymerase sigma factor [Candidatus Eremiobacteraeota bacterium]|nr:RNA polymerase sigma factor [Candidatus Eremiobacteraeota bacterium]
MEKNLSEQELVKQCIEGDQKAWEVLYRLHYSRVRHIVSWPKWGFGPAEAEDVVQEVFMELVRSLPHYRGEAQISTFLTHLSKNKCVSLLRKKLAKKRGKEDRSVSLDSERTSFDEPQVVAVEGGPTPEEAYMKKEGVETVLAAIPGLSDECQSVIRLRFFQDKSYEEICEELAIPLGTLCSRLKRCLLKLRKVTEKKVGFP